MHREVHVYSTDKDLPAFSKEDKKEISPIADYAAFRQSVCVGAGNGDM